MDDDLRVFSLTVALATVGLVVALTLVSLGLFPPRPDVSPGVSLELAFAVIPLAGIVFVSRLDVERRVGWPLLVGLLFLSLHFATEVTAEIVFLPTLFSALLVEVTLLVGTLLLLVGLSRWSDERTRRERLLEERQRRLVELNDQLEVLTRLMRHDIRNDVAVAVGWTELLAEHVDDEEGRRAIDRITDACENIEALTDTAYDLIQVLSEEPEDVLRTTATDVRAVLEDEVRKARDRHDEASFSVEYGDGLDGTRVVANELLHSVFANLLTNAVAHNDRDEPRVSVRAALDGNRVRIRIADDDPGFPDGRKTEIFRKGQRGLDSTGTGIGLYLVQTLLNRYGGSIHVVDNEPRGAVFVVDLLVAIGG